MNVSSRSLKTDELSAILHSNNVDICCVSETWLNENTPTESVDIEHYNFVIVVIDLMAISAVVLHVIFEVICHAVAWSFSRHQA